jgi:hypothetical protein
MARREATAATASSTQSHQNRSRQVLPIEREQIKGEVSSEVTPLHQISKDASAEMIAHDQLAIEDGRLRIHLLHQCRLREGRERNGASISESGSIGHPLGRV